MEAAQVLAAYSLGDADNLRRAMGKKKADVMEAEKSVFVDGCENNSIGKKKANEIFDRYFEYDGYLIQKIREIWDKISIPEDLNKYHEEIKALERHITLFN